jgi:hypothetical protein
MGFRPWDQHEGSKEYVKNLHKKLIFPTYDDSLFPLGFPFFFFPTIV